LGQQLHGEHLLGGLKCLEMICTGNFSSVLVTTYLCKFKICCVSLTPSFVMPDICVLI
jgi:hypothetical protein